MERSNVEELTEAVPVRKSELLAAGIQRRINMREKDWEEVGSLKRFKKRGTATVIVRK